MARQGRVGGTRHGADPSVYAEAPEISRQPAADAEAEVAKLEKTLAAAEEELRGLYETAKEKMGEQEAEIFDAHLTILGDEYSRPGADHPAHPRAEAECRRRRHGPVRRAWRRCSAPSATS